MPTPAAPTWAPCWPAPTTPSTKQSATAATASPPPRRANARPRDGNYRPWPNQLLELTERAGLDHAVPDATTLRERRASVAVAKRCVAADFQRPPPCSAVRR